MSALVNALASLRVRFNPEDQTIEVLEGALWRKLAPSSDAPGDYCAFQLAEPAAPIAREQVCCTKCGGVHVSYAVWFHPLTADNGEIFGSWNEDDSSFCDDCEEGGSLLSRGENPERFDALRAASVAAEDYIDAVERCRAL